MLSQIIWNSVERISTVPAVGSDRDDAELATICNDMSAARRSPSGLRRCWRLRDRPEAPEDLPLPAAGLRTGERSLGRSSAGSRS